jgi:DNA repair exonuclease SbcCD ATPase subunit
MRDLLKEESKNIKLGLERIMGEISATSKSITNSQREIEELTNKLIQNSEEKIKEIEESLEKFKSLLDIHRNKLNEFKEKESLAMSEVRKSLEILNSCKSEINGIDSKISLYRKDKCPTCSGDFRTEFYESLLNDLEKRKKDLTDDLLKFENQYSEAKKQENLIISSRAEFISKGNKIEMNISNLKNELAKIKSGRSDDQIASLNKILANLQTDLETFNSTKSRDEGKSIWIKTLDEVLGEKGVKQLAIKTILPSLNKQILELLLELHLPYKVVFNEEFNASIYHMGEEISTQTLSTGEMKKVDFAVLVAVIKLMKIRFASVNLLFLDEIFSSVDPDGVYTILSTLRKICDDMGLNIFVINHAPMPTEIFDWRIDIQKRNNFSDIKMEKTE